MIKNKNILITGGNSGIGFFAIINLLKTKNNLYLVIKSELRKNQFLKINEIVIDCCKKILKVDSDNFEVRDILESIEEN